MWVINMNGGTSERGQMRTGLEKSRKKWLSKELCFLIITEEGENKEASVSRP